MKAIIIILICLVITVFIVFIFPPFFRWLISLVDSTPEPNDPRLKHPADTPPEGNTDPEDEINLEG